MVDRDRKATRDAGTKASSAPGGARKDSPLGSIRLLVIVHDPSIAASVISYLEAARKNYLVYWQESLGVGLEALSHFKFDACLLDLELPDASGAESLIALETAEPSIPIVALTSSTDDEYASEALRLGAQEFIRKDELNSGTLSRSIEYAIERCMHRAEMEALAHFDALTGLPNRQRFLSQVDQTLRLRAKDEKRAALLFIDVDHFKEINDSLGHGAGDDCLRHLGRRLGDQVGLAGRLGGDEFAVLLEDVRDERAAMAVARSLLESLAEPITLGGATFVATVSVGVSLYPDDAQTRQQLMTCADEAMYRAKRAGRNNCQLYRKHRHHFDQQRLQMHSALREALALNAFELHYQPQFHLQSGDLIGLEALIRWWRTPNDLAMPGDFLAELEHSGLVYEVGAWVIEEACRCAQTWRGTLGKSRVAVNVSASQLQREGFIGQVHSALDSSGLSPERLELEITEESLLDDREVAIRTLLALREIGVRVVMDDFGTGYSSMDYLRRYPVNAIKLDPSFVRNIDTSRRDAAIAQSLIDLSHQLGLEVVGEGIENVAQLSQLRAFGCDIGQGYLLGRPSAQLPPGSDDRSPPAQTEDPYDELDDEDESGEDLFADVGHASNH